MQDADREAPIEQADAQPVQGGTDCRSQARVKEREQAARALADKPIAPPLPPEPVTRLPNATRKTLKKLLQDRRVIAYLPHAADQSDKRAHEPAVTSHRAVGAAVV